jgi:hypothetical protein
MVRVAIVFAFAFMTSLTSVVNFATAKTPLSSLEKKNAYACAVKKSMDLNPFPYLEYEGAHGSLVDLFSDGTLEFYDNGRCYWQNKNGTENLVYSEDKSILSRIEPVKMVWLRKVAVADINNDGKDDLFLIAHGWDFPPHPGEESLLLLSDGDGYKSINPKFGIGFWHSGAVGDVNNDGLADLLLVTTSKGNNTLAVQKRDGTFKKHTLPLGFSSDVKRVVAGEIIDVDENGNHDIVVSSSFGSKLTVLWGNGTGKFTNKSSVDVPKPFNHVVDINFGDVDADGKKELIILATQGNSEGKSNFYKGYSVMLAAISKRKIEKPKTLYSSKNVRWFPWLYVCDLDGSGKDEIYSFRQEKDLDGKKNGYPAFHYSHVE